MHYLRVFVVSLFIFLNIAFAQATTAVKTTKVAIFKSITHLNNTLNRKTAWLYADIIDKYSKLYGIDPLLIVAIAKQEGDFILNKKNGYFEKIYDDDGEISHRYITTDYCMMQINKSNLVHMNLNPKKLLTDPDYCIKAGVKILASLKPFKRYEKNWWSRYNSVNPKFRALYKRQVLRFYHNASQTV